MTESIFLLSAKTLANTAVTVIGTSNNGPPTSIDVSLNGGATWTTCSGYMSNVTTLNCAFTATGPVCAPGVYYVRVRDTNSATIASAQLQMIVDYPALGSTNYGMPQVIYDYPNCANIPVQAVASQQISVSLGGVQVTLNIYSRGGSLYIDYLPSAGLPLYGVVCQNQNLIVRDSYFGLTGDLAFYDTQGSDDPQYTGLGTRWLLGYFTP